MLHGANQPCRPRITRTTKDMSYTLFVIPWFSKHIQTVLSFIYTFLTYFSTNSLKGTHRHLDPHFSLLLVQIIKGWSTKKLSVSSCFLVLTTQLFTKVTKSGKTTYPSQPSESCRGVITMDLVYSRIHDICNNSCSADLYKLIIIIIS